MRNVVHPSQSERDLFEVMTFYSTDFMDLRPHGSLLVPSYYICIVLPKCALNWKLLFTLGSARSTDTFFPPCNLMAALSAESPREDRGDETVLPFWCYTFSRQSISHVKSLFLLQELEISCLFNLPFGHNKASVRRFLAPPSPPRDIPP